MRSQKWLEDVRHDVGFALRQFGRAPGFTIVSVATLALGIGANSAIFALVDATLLRPLPLPEPDRVVLVLEHTDRSPRGPVSPLNMMDWDERSHAIDRFGGFASGVGGMVMTGADGTADTVSRQWVSSGFFDALGAAPIAGRTFTVDDDRVRAQVVVMSEGFWRSRFAADSSVVGRDIRLDGDPYRVVGIVPDEFQVLGRTSLWALMSFDRNPALRGAYGLLAIGRLRPGVSLDAARADMATVTEALAREFPATNSGRGVVIEPLHDALMGSDLRLTSMLFLGVVAIVLLICCANVANLLLARATVRTRELAIRLALGAGRSRVVRQLVTESLVLSGTGAVVGIGIGSALVSAAPAVLPSDLLPGAVTIAFDGRVIAFCALTAVAVGLIFGLVPAWQATNFPAAAAADAETRTTTSGGGKLRTILVTSEVATAVLLLCGAGLLLRTLTAVETVDRGYRADRVLTMMVDPLSNRYPSHTALLQFFGDVERELAGVPGVGSAAWTTTLPLGAAEGGQRFFEVVGDAALPGSERPVAHHDIVSATYFETVDVPIVAGRAFSDRDTSESAPVCIVNEAFVRGHLRGRSPIGRRIVLRPSPQANPIEREIVGVARQVKGRPDETTDVLQVYVPLTQLSSDDIYLVVRSTTGPAEALTASVRRAISRVDREQLVSVRDIMTLEDVAADAVGRHRFRAIIVSTFAGLALTLAMIGVFGVLSYMVQQRERDFAVRRALGAATGDVLRLVVANAMRVVLSGATIGLVLAALLGRTLTSVLYGVEPIDAVTFAAVGLVLLITAMMAVATPAWRAVRIDPAVSLRNN